MTAHPSTPQSNIELMRRAFSALERKDVDACVKLMPSDFTINIAGMPYQKRGTEAWRKHAEILFSAFPDIQIHIEDIFASDDKVAVRMRVTGTHTGAFIALNPQERKYRTRSTNSTVLPMEKSPRSGFAPTCLR